MPVVRKEAGDGAPGSIAPRRHPAQGGYARGVDARQRIILAALEVFGQEGFRNASTRQIAEAADVKRSALAYYFDSKSGLHRACGEFLSERFRLTLQKEMAKARTVLEAGTPILAVEAICDLLGRVLEFSIGSPDASSGSRFLARMQAEDSDGAMSDLRRNIMSPVIALAEALAGLAMGRDVADERTRMAVRAIMGTLVTLIAATETQSGDRPNKAYYDIADETFRRLARAAVAPCAAPLPQQGG